MNASLGQRVAYVVMTVLCGGALLLAAWSVALFRFPVLALVAAAYGLCPIVCLESGRGLLYARRMSFLVGSAAILVPILNAMDCPSGQVMCESGEPLWYAVVVFGLGVVLLACGAKLVRDGV